MRSSVEVTDVAPVEMLLDPPLLTEWQLYSECSVLVDIHVPSFSSCSVRYDSSRM